MRALINIFLLFIFLSGCVHSAIKSAEIPDIDEYLRLQNILDGISYRGCWEYQLGVFDCSNQTALLHDFLTAKGYECNIVLGINPSLLFYGRGWHVWLIAEKNGKKFWIESVIKKIVSFDDFEHYTVKINLGSLKRAKKLSRLIRLSYNWDY